MIRYNIDKKHFLEALAIYRRFLSAQKMSQKIHEEKNDDPRSQKTIFKN